MIYSVKSSLFRGFLSTQKRVPLPATTSPASSVSSTGAVKDFCEHHHGHHRGHYCKHHQDAVDAVRMLAKRTEKPKETKE